MTLLEKHHQCLLDLMQERHQETDERWQRRLDKKIEDMKYAMALVIAGEGK